MRSHLRPLLLTVLALAVAGPALARKKHKDGDSSGRVSVPTTIGPTVSPPTDLFLRNSFDTDPSRYLGRFLPDGATILDESSSIKTQCSTFISWEKIGGGDVVHDELFQLSDKAAASFGIPPFISAKGGGEQTQMVRITYTSTGKMVSDIADPAGFEACCKQAPDQCTDRYVGEFIEGSQGQVFYAVGNAAGFQASGVGDGMAGDIDIKHGMAWQRGIQFPNPVYFAFKTMNSGFGSGGVVAEPGCGPWVDSPPRSSQGSYFVGISEFLDSERLARQTALVDARKQTVQWLGESITTGSTEVTGYTGSASDLATRLDQASFLETAATGVASMVKDENWCLEQQVTPRGTLVQAKVLAFIPKDQYTAAAAVLGADATEPTEDGEE